MDDGENRLERLNEILAGLKAGKLKVEDCMGEIGELAGPRFESLSALVAADNLHERYDAGEVDAAEALSMAQGYANDYPTVPILFLYCSFYAHGIDDDFDSIGYLALYRLKSEQIGEFSDFGRHREWGVGRWVPSWPEGKRPGWCRVEPAGPTVCARKRAPIWAR